MTAAVQTTTTATVDGAVYHTEWIYVYHNQPGDDTTKRRERNRI